MRHIDTKSNINRSTHTHAHTEHEIAIAIMETSFKGAHRHKIMPRSVAICVHTPHRTKRVCGCLRAAGCGIKGAL